MKKYKILLATAALLGLSSCIEETLPTEYVLNDQIQASESALEGMVNSIYTSMCGYKNDDGGIEMISYGSMRAMLEHSTTQFVCSGANGSLLLWSDQCNRLQSWVISFLSVLFLYQECERYYQHD